MNLEKIKNILDSQYPDEIKEHQLIWALAEERRVSSIISRVKHLSKYIKINLKTKNK